MSEDAGRLGGAGRGAALERASERSRVITSAELKAQQVETLADALRGVPGQTIVRSGGRGALTSLFPRGGESDYTLVLVDGVRLNASAAASTSRNLAVEDVERVEVVRGPQSALYGADAIGGVVRS